MLQRSHGDGIEVLEAGGRLPDIPVADIGSLDNQVPRDFTLETGLPLVGPVRTAGVRIDKVSGRRSRRRSVIRPADYPRAHSPADPGQQVAADARQVMIAGEHGIAVGSPTAQATR